MLSATAGALWGRGNSWYTAGLVDYLECLDGNEGVKKFLLTTLLRQAQALEKSQELRKSPAVQGFGIPFWMTRILIWRPLHPALLLMEF